MPDPKIGEMILYDYIRPSLLAGRYRMRVQTDVTVTTTATPLPGTDFHFDVEGPRFSLAPSEVAGVFPPRNGHGSFDSALPHVALGRRTLPWERALGDDYTVAAGQTPYPFLALVLLEQDECEILHDQSLTDVVPNAVFSRLGSPAGIRCDAVEADEQLLREILPMPEELQLLTHVRQVNVDDRELAAGDSDGYFAVVMSNRVPRAGGSYVACLVSVEERSDLLPTSDPDGGFHGGIFGDVLVAQIAESSELAPSALGTSVTAPQADAMRLVAAPATAARFVTGAVTSQVAAGSSKELQVAKLLERQRLGLGAVVLHPKARLVLLHSWTFVCEGDGTFRQLMQGLDVGMVGDADPASKLAVTDTGHVTMDVTDRLGAPEQSWYRGPLVSQPLTRDTLGPYHSADQARRVVAETGAENISYASAFEVGRLLAAADARLAQELMRWRRGAFRASSRQESVVALQDAMHLTAITDPREPVALRYTVDVLDKITAGIVAPVDPFGIERVLGSPLLQLDVIAKAFGLGSVADARVLLGEDPGLAAPVTVRKPDRVLGTVDDVLGDEVGLAALADLRAAAIDAVRIEVEGEPQ